ncbi:type IV toxin-antitoxin system AbiEi family antitoxin domain-containing protein [Actinotalea sp.]|uniref:type IV toxin-antitoxin system AbiEi family antitoxin domain-containing protein n=1 Tax=Actinotalea sp. TaxID=1872145 RepID=UPI002C359C27|nr:type IV toxin-antitoxin system AbiEi family antitoxin domain-containing protein [Actinotalea sp.]HQY33607.1 type IV toxin-antitoxin system AbiEi family antitoxin domain-containing protein [Actinotalea sp.]HRA50164.1 type IV toxin-antitoxin system AbiEi family antitoxin domain-containing protein [Actinotalea sp.]
MRRPPESVLQVALRQDGVVAAAQLTSLGVDDSAPGRWVAAGLWQRLHRGVYCVHTGPVPWRTRASAALLYAGPGAAIGRRGAAHLHGFLAAPPQTIEVEVPARRTVRPSPGLQVRRRRTMPPSGGRLRAIVPAETVVDLLGDAPSADAAVGLLASAVRAGVAPHAILDALGARSRVPRRALALELLGEVADGIESPLEHRYHVDVERRHGLPTSRLQRRERVGGRWIRADSVYEGFGVRSELDGEVAHPGGRTDDDVWRDNAVLIERGDLTLRFRWRHVRATPCRTAAQVEAALRSRGWTGQARPCGPGCPVGP